MVSDRAIQFTSMLPLHPRSELEETERSPSLALPWLALPCSSSDARYRHALKNVGLLSGLSHAVGLSPPPARLTVPYLQSRRHSVARICRRRSARDTARGLVDTRIARQGAPAQDLQGEPRCLCWTRVTVESCINADVYLSCWPTPFGCFHPSPRTYASATTRRRTNRTSRLASHVRGKRASERHRASSHPSRDG